VFNAPGVSGATSAFRELRELGHSVTIAERHHAGLLGGIPVSAKSVEGAMQVEDVGDLVVEEVSARRGKGSSATWAGASASGSKNPE
jgi:hypothetical protein